MTECRLFLEALYILVPLCTSISFLTRYHVISFLDGPDVSISQGDSLQVEEGMEMTLNCLVDAKPNPTIKWFRGKSVHHRSYSINPRIVVTLLSGYVMRYVMSYVIMSELGTEMDFNLELIGC